MRRVFLGATVAALLAVTASPGRAGDEAESAPAADETAAAVEESHDILARQPITDRAAVVHVLIGWADLAEAYGGRMPERAQARSAEEAAELAGRILAEARAGADFKALMKTHSEDWGSAETGRSYPVTPEAGLVAPFKALSLRLEVDEVGLVKSRYGWHIIKRIH